MRKATRGQKGLRVSGKAVALELGLQPRGFQVKRTAWAKAKKRDGARLGGTMSVGTSGVAEQSLTAS